MAMSDFPQAPSISDTTNFATEADAWVAHFTNTFIAELDAAIAAFNFNATNSTSTTSDTIATGSTTITTQTGKSYLPGMTIKSANTADGTKWMLGEVTAYDSGTGSLTFYSRLINGSGTYSDWTITLAATPQDVGDHYFICHTPNGHGSTNTKNRLYTTTSASAGTALTVTHSATLGTYATVNEAGDYEFEMGDSNSGGTCHYGVSVNSSQRTQSISSITFANRISPIAFNVPAGAYFPYKTPTLKLAVGDIVVPHTDGNPNSTVDLAVFIGRKVGNG